MHCKSIIHSTRCKTQTTQKIVEIQNELIWQVVAEDYLYRIGQQSLARKSFMHM